MDVLADCLKSASEGGSKEIKKFLETFIVSKVFVPEKNQPLPISSKITYPDRIFNYFAVEDAGQIKIPVFSDESRIGNWSSAPLIMREVQVRRLIELLPENWCITVNPNDDFSKDFTYWELNKLLGGSDEINEVTNEIISELGIQALSVRALKENEIPELRHTIQKLFDINDSIESVFAAIEQGENVEGGLNETLLLGFKLKHMEPAQLKSFRLNAEQIISPILIGSINLKVLAGVGFSDLELGVFADFSPLIQRIT